MRTMATQDQAFIEKVEKVKIYLYRYSYICFACNYLLYENYEICGAAL